MGQGLVATCLDDRFFYKTTFRRNALWQFEFCPLHSMFSMGWVARTERPCTAGMFKLYSFCNVFSLLSNVALGYVRRIVKEFTITHPASRRHVRRENQENTDTALAEATAHYRRPGNMVDGHPACQEAPVLGERKGFNCSQMPQNNS